MGHAGGGVAAQAQHTPTDHAHSPSSVYHYPTHHNNNNMMLEAYSTQATTEVNSTNGTSSDILQKVVRHVFFSFHDLRSL